MQRIVLACVVIGIMSFVVAGQELQSLQPTGMAKPIADLRDYNATYDGSKGTGTIGYGLGTLYRDNQDDGAVSGCRGESCGKHPGVDIPVPSGTKVYVALGGTVMISRCDKSWGGLVVIRAQNPWNYPESVYFVYAHMRSRRYRDESPVLAGQIIPTGISIGESGGHPDSDKCAGNSTGPHLHFQIDKEDGSPEPWYPNLAALNTRDTNFEVTARTYNPIPFITGGLRWSFWEAGNREWWDLFNFSSWGVSDGALWFDGMNDPHIRRGGLANCGLRRPCSSDISMEASEYPRVYLDLHNNCLSNPGKLYFTTAVEPFWDESKTIHYYPGWGSNRTFVWMANHPKWKGIVTGLRIDPAQQCQPTLWDPTYFGEITIQR